MSKQVERRRGARYTISPFQLLINDGNYYLLAFDDYSKEMRTYRVDRMKDIRFTGEPRDGDEEFKQIDLKTYTKRVFSMYGGEQRLVEIRFINPLLDAVVDRFGTKDEPQILVGKDKKRIDAADTTDATAKFIPYKESDSDETTGTSSRVAYPENWQGQVGVSYEIKKKRGNVLDAVSASDIRNRGTKVINPFIGVIPSYSELEDELEQIYDAM